jgi:hypothetical protein
MKENTRNILFAILGVVIILSSLWIIFNQSREIERHVVEVRYEIGAKTGFNVEGERLNFGRLIPGSKSTRSLSVNNTHPFDVYVQVTADPKNANLLIFNYSSFLLKPAEELRLPVTFAASTDAVVGNYSSFVVVHIRK